MREKLNHGTNGPLIPGNLWAEGCSTFPCRDPNHPPYPWHLPGDQHSLHPPPTPGTVPPAPSHATLCLASLSTKHKALPFPAVAKPQGLENPPPAWQSSWRRRSTAKEELAKRLGKLERSYL